MNDCATWWAGEAGNAYTQRNRVNWLQRVPFWTHMIALTGACSVFELGCNFGANLLAIRAVRPEIALTGVDVNVMAWTLAKRLGLSVAQLCEDYPSFSMSLYDLTFTAGVLIHVPPEKLEGTMRAMIAGSRQYVLAIEYEARDEEEIVYRGEKGRLWKRPYGKLYEDLGLKEVASGYANKEDGFDSCTWWLLQK